MKVLVVFGSTSDANISSPLVEKLARHADVEFHVISAHRDLEKLQQKILTWRGDAIVAGAGLAAALPGVVAAMTTLPVFGLPVAAQYAGLDAFASIAQMPPGVPVLTAGPDNMDAIDLFITQMAGQDFSKLHLVVKNTDWLEHPDLLAEIAKLGDIDLTRGTVADPARFNIYIVTDETDVDATAFGLHVPFFAKADTKKPENYLLTLRLAQKGGIWVGTNNLRNAVAAAKRLNTRAAGLPDIIYQGSVKDVRGVTGQSPYIFEFSDRYSIFDWGQMPDLLNNKGAALAWMSGFFFDFLGAPATWQNWQAPAALQNNPVLQNLRQHGLSHHAFGLVDGQPRCLAVRPVSVLRPDSRQENGKLVWDYAAYAARPEHALVPLEVIFRFGVPDGSSLLQRTGDAQYCRDIGLSAAPKAGDVFDVPVIEYSTKLETSDRYMPYAEAQQIAGLSDTEFSNLTMIAKLVALRLRDCFADIDTVLWDGKIECAFTATGTDGARGFMLVDSIGPDELRLTRNGVHLSKEALRGFYRPTAWHTQLEAAKKLAASRGEKDWKHICTDELHATPPALPATVKAQAEMIYTGIARALSRAHGDGTAFADAWDLDAVVAGFTALKKDAA